MSDEPIDFGPLDPQRDPRRFNAMVNAIVDRVTAPDLWQALAMQWRMALAMATAVALVAWLVVRPPPPPDRASDALLAWAADPTGASGAALLATLQERP